MFQKKVEDFTCEHCGFFVAGTGYTNHCPSCLHGKHVDIHPGDREETCHGLMEPIEYDPLHGGVLTHRCVRCHTVRNNKVQKEDRFEALLAVTEKRVIGLSKENHKTNTNT